MKLSNFQAQLIDEWKKHLEEGKNIVISFDKFSHKYAFRDLDSDQIFHIDKLSHKTMDALIKNKIVTFKPIAIDSGFKRRQYLEAYFLNI